MNRVCFCNGPWQLIVLATALRQERAAARGGAPDAGRDCLVLYGRAHEAGLRASLREIAPRLWPWARIVEIEDLAHAPSHEEAADCLRRTADEIGEPAVDEVWLAQFLSHREKLHAQIWPDARLVMYEDGLGLYLNGYQYRPLTALQTLKRTLEWRDPFKAGRHYLLSRRDAVYRAAQLGLIPEQMSRMDRMCLVLSEEIPLPEAFKNVPVVRLEPSALRETIRQYARHTDTAGIEEDAPEGASSRRVLMLGQNFSDYDGIGWDEELEMYRSIMASLAGAGYRVVWKEHPRASRPFFPHLRAALGRSAVTEAAIPPGVPVEIAAERGGFAACVAAASSSLFYLPLLYNIPAYSFAKRMLSRWENLSRLCVERVAPVEELYQHAEATPAAPRTPPVFKGLLTLTMAAALLQSGVL